MPAAMFLRISRSPLKSVRPPTVCPHRPAIGKRSQNCQTIFETSASSFTSSKPPRNARHISNPTAPKKPSSAVITHRLPPTVSKVQDTQRNSLALSLVREGKLLLFKAPSHAGFISAAWTAGALCLGGALIISSQRLYEANPGLPWFVPGVYRIVAIFMVAFGTWAILRSSRLISSIEILPGKEKARLLFSIRRNIPLPFIKPKKMTLYASDITLERKVVTMMGQPPADAGSLGIARRISGTLFSFFAGSRQFFFSDGIVNVHVAGHKGTWKLDWNGLFLDGGRPLFQLVKFDA